MAFLNPVLLFGMTAIAAPIIIHLLNRRKFEKISWAAMRFLRTSFEQTQRRLQVEDLLLLLIRCLLVLLVAMALTRPAFRGARAAALFGANQVTAVFVIDNSYSMSQTDGVNSRFEKAKQAALQSLDSLPAGSSASFILASDISQQVIPEPTFDLNYVRKNIQTAELCDRGTDLMPAFNDAARMLKTKTGKREIYLVTDGQLGGFRQMDAITKLLGDNRDTLRAHVQLVGAAEQQNLGVSDIKTMTEIPAVDEPIRFSVQVTNFGQVQASSIHVTLKVDDDPPCDQGVIDSLARGQTKIITLSAKLRSEGYHTVTGSIPADRLPADDSRTLAVRARKDVRLLLVDGTAGGEPRDAQTLFLRHALVPVPRSEADRYFLKTQVISPRQLATQNLEDFDAVFLCDVPDLPTNMLQALPGYLRRGNSLIVFPGPDTNASFYNTELAKKLSILPAEFGAPQGDPAEPEKFLTFQRDHFTHPIVDLWNDSASGDANAAHFYRTLPLHPMTVTSEQAEAGVPVVVLSFSDDAHTPAMMERAFGAGNVIQFSSTANAVWNDLPGHAGLYVPLIRRTLGWAMQQEDRSLNVTVGDPLVLHPSPDTLNQQATISRAHTLSGARTTRTVEFVNHLPTLSVPDTGIAGAYDVELAGKTYKFAVQQRSTNSITDSESSLIDLAPPEIQKLSAVADVVPPGQSMAESATHERSGAEFWFPIMAIVLVLGIAEVFLAHWFSVPK